MIRLASFYDYGFSVSALWCPLVIPTVLLGFLLPWTSGISSGLLLQSAAAAPYLGRWVSPHTAPPDLERGVAPPSPPAPGSSLLGGGVAPLCRCPWPGTWGSSSRPTILRCRSLALSFAAPDLGQGVAPHCQASARPVTAGGLRRGLCVFICIHIYLSISVSLHIYIHICLKLKKKETKILTAVMANMKSKLMGKIFLYFNPCQIRGKMHLQIIGWQFLFKFLLQGQLFLLTSFWMLGFIYAAQHSMMNAKVKCLGEINCQTEFRHYSFYEVKKVSSVIPRHL